MSTRFPPESPLHLFTEAEVEALFAAGTVRTCAAGEVVITEGEPGDSMFFLLEGQAEARGGSGRAGRTYLPGSYFGELSFINAGHRRAATIVITAPARLQVLDQGSIEALLKSHPRAVFMLVRRACAFLVEAERHLVADLRRRNTELEETIRHLEVTRTRLSQEEQTARTDALTGLFNRRAFDSELPVFMERARALGTGLAVIAMDLDHFKPVNDRLGHAAGDAVLRGVGKILQQGVRKTDLPCRLGGDEFVVLLSGLTEAAAHGRAEAIRAAIGALSHPGNEAGIQVTATMGGAMYRPGDDVAALLHRADEALYAAKRAGRNQVGWAPAAG